ncbi:MAG: hypothetical protein ACRDHG_08400 [Anaerolineales bacterium]
MRGTPDLIAKQSSAVVLFLLLWLLLSAASYFLLTIGREQRFDFFPRWVGARAVLRGEDPYSEEVTWRIQEESLGYRAQPGEDQYRFTYSATITWLLLPFWLLPFPLAVSLWCGLQFFLLLVLPLWVVSILGWRIRPAQLIVILIFSIVVYRYPVNAYLIGQFIPFSLACLVAAWWGLVRGKWIVSSLALVLAMVRPEVVVLPVLALLVVAWQTGHRRTVWTWLISIVCLWLLTRVWIGAWEGNFLREVVAYTEYSFPVWPPGLLKPAWLAPLIVIGVLGWSGWMWKGSGFLDSTQRPGWIVSVATLTTLVVFPQSDNYNLILGLLSVWITLWVWRRRYALWIPVLAVLASPWIFRVAGAGLSTLEHLLIPLSIAALQTFAWLDQRRNMARTGRAVDIGPAQAPA